MKSKVLRFLTVILLSVGLVVGTTRESKIGNYTARENNNGLTQEAQISAVCSDPTGIAREMSYYGFGGGGSGGSLFSELSLAAGAALVVTLGIPVKTAGDCSKYISSTHNVISEGYCTKADNASDDTSEEEQKLNDELEKRLRDAQKDMKIILQLLTIFTGLECFADLKKREDKVITIGRDIDKEYNLEDNYYYQKVAEKNDWISFYAEDFNDLIETYSFEIGILNEFLIKYGILLDYDFFLVTDPYYYVQYDFDPYLRIENRPIGGRTYYLELKEIRLAGYNRFVNFPSYTWENLKPVMPGLGRMSYFAYAGYRVSR